MRTVAIDAEAVIDCFTALKVFVVESANHASMVDLFLILWQRSLSD